MVRFGPYVVRPGARTVLKNGLRVRLYGQSFEILLMLLERGGEVVTREELKKRLWPDETFVDFDHGLNAAIRNLRRALGDRPESPTYIETVPRIGYRLIAEISLQQDGELSSGSVEDGKRTQPETYDIFARQATIEASNRHPVDVIGAGLPTPAKQLPASPTRRRVGVKLLGGVVVAVVALAVAAGVWVVRNSPPTPQVMQIRQLTKDGRVNVNANLVLCGSRIYFVSELNGVIRLASVSISGGAVEFIPPPFERFEILGASPDGAELLLSRIELGYPVLPVRRSLWRYILGTRTVRPVGNMYIYDAAWLPDGSGILYSNETDQTLNLIDPAGLNSKQLARVPGTVNKIRFAPDGKTFRASIISPNRTITLWQYDLAHNTCRRLLSDWDDSVVVWAGGWLAGSRYFACVRSKDRIGTVWALPEPSSWLDRGGGKPVQLAAGSVTFRRPVTAPGGDTVYVVGLHDTGQLMRYDLKAKTYEPFMAGFSADQLTYSPDGKWMAYVTFPDHALVTSRIDGSERLQLTFAPLWPDTPRWSPDSSQLVFEAILLPEEKERVYVVPARGGTPRALAPGAGEDQIGAQWSSDGQTVIFFTPISEADPASAMHRFDWRNNKDTVSGGFKNFRGGLFSPDGNSIAAQSSDGTQSLIVHDIASNSNRMLAPYVEFLHWSGDSKYLFYSTLMNGPMEGKGKGAIYRVRVADGRTEMIAPAPDFLIAGNWGPWMDIAPDGSPLVLKHTGDSDIYAIDVNTVGPRKR